MPRPDFIADTSAVVRRLRGDARVEPFFSRRTYAITFITLGELKIGALKSRDPVGTWEDVSELLRAVDLLVATQSTPLFYASTYRDLERRGLKIPTNDIWIAAVCLELQLPLLARDEHFQRITGLTVIEC